MTKMIPDNVTVEEVGILEENGRLYAYVKYYFFNKNSGAKTGTTELLTEVSSIEEGNRLLDNMGY